MSMSQFNFKGDASGIRAKLDEAKKADLRASHFDVGQRSYKMVTTSQSSLRPQTTQYTPLNKE